MRVVFDTNVFVSAALKENSVPSLALRLASDRDTLLKSDATERQLLAVLARPKIARFVSPASVTWFQNLLSRAELVAIAEHVTACRDPTDGKFLELAVNGQAAFRRIPIVPPVAFLQLAKN